MSTFEQLGTEIGQLVAKKNQAYGDAAAKTARILAILYPNGIPVEKYSDALLVVRVLDKFSRIADGDKKAFEENPWRDVAGYGLLGTMKELKGDAQIENH